MRVSERKRYVECKSRFSSLLWKMVRFAEYQDCCHGRIVFAFPAFQDTGHKSVLLLEVDTQQTSTPERLQSPRRLHEPWIATASQNTPRCQCRRVGKPNKAMAFRRWTGTQKITMRQHAALSRACVHSTGDGAVLCADAKLETKTAWKALQDCPKLASCILKSGVPRLTHPQFAKCGLP